MPFCPNCKYEYIDTIKICPDCKVDIVPSLPESKHLSSEELELVYTCSYLYDAEMIKSNLESAGIEADILSQKDRNYPGVGDLAVIKVYVKKEDKDAALEFIKDMGKSKTEKKDSNGG